MLSLINEKQGNCGKKEQKAISLICRFLPYLILLGASFLPFSCYFQLGNNLPNGDDSLWHRIWAWDLSSGWADGFFFVTPSHNLMGNLGLGTYLFYGPLSHFMVAFLHLICSFISINTCWKFFSILLTFAMGSWMYMLGKRICKNDVCGLMLGLCLIFSPYRINCLLYRAAYPEAFALSFYPLIFLGVHELGHEDYRPQAFISCVLGVAACILCHPFTGMVGTIAGAVYLLCCYKGFIGLFKSKKNIIYTVSTIVLIVFLISFYVFPMLHYTNSGLYNVSDNQLMWTNYAHLAWSTYSSDQFSGFLRPIWIDDLVPNSYKFPNIYNESWLSWCLDYVYFGFFGGSAVFLVSFLSAEKRPFLGSLLGAVCSCLALIFTSRPEMFLIVPLFAVCILLIGMSEQESFDRWEAKREFVDGFKNPALYWSVLLFVGCFILVYIGEAWSIMPSIFYTAQFAWRLWGAILFLALIILGLLIVPVRQKKYTHGALAIVAGLSFLSCMGVVDKRFCIQAGQAGNAEPNLSMVMEQRKQGVQNEYVPRVFNDSTYKSEYSNSLYSEIRAEVYTRSYISYQYGIEDYLTPAVLEGSGSLTITSLHSPEATFDVSIVTDETLVQLPQFYYEGYRMVLSGDSSYKVDGINVDGLVSFRLKKGTYTAQLKWVGLASYRIGVPLFFLGIAGTAAMYFVPFGIDACRKHKEKMEKAE